MKKFFKILLLSIVILVLITISGFAIFKKVYTPTHLRDVEEAIDEIVVDLPDTEDEEDEEIVVIIEKTEEELWAEAIVDSDRVNILLFGTDGLRADTLMMMSYSKKDDDITMISVPRDTQNFVEGKDGPGHHKINAVFSFNGGTTGAIDQREAIEKIMGVPIHYYVKVNYYGLEAVVNTLGGINVTVPFDMKYDDRWAEPELHIDLKEGNQTLNGNQAMEYIRWRKNNDGWGDSDLERSKRQQDMIIKIVRKSVGFDILKVIGICYDYVRTDMSKEDMLYYGSDLITFDLSSINKYTLPGEAKYVDGLSFYIKDEEAIKALMYEIYGFKETLQQ